MNASAMLSGGCACGAVRYALHSPPFDAGYCHCRLCQLTSGAPVMAFATVPVGDFRIVAGERAVRRSSDFGERGFCAACGTPLTMQVDHQPDTIDFTIATLDDPSALAPQFHIWDASRIAWFEMADALPRHAGFRPDTVGLDDGVSGGDSSASRGAWLSSSATSSGAR
ncbi:GFA family protein [Sphingobium sp. RSMS]|nr:GFA family protein [Sphingobium sp. RSMS]